MFLHLYQIFSSLQGHLHFFVHFFFTFMENFFIGHPIHIAYKARNTQGKSLKMITVRHTFGDELMPS